MAGPNWANRTIFTGDNLDIMRGMNSQSVDLIYLDPPFNSNRNYSAPVGSEAAGAAFKDAWTMSDVKAAEHGEIADRNPALYKVIDAAGAAHGKPMMACLIMMSVRLLEMQRILKPTGSIYLHCDPTASHYLKIMLDSIFGERNFRSEIVWKRTRAFISRRHYGNISDTLLFYTRSNDYTWNAPYIPYPREEPPRLKQYLGEIPGAPVQNVWDDINPLLPHSKERTGYPGQKPLALLERIIRASSNAGDMVLDPFCGCATTCVAAERLERQWVGIDKSPKTCELVVRRFSDAQPTLPDSRIICRRDIPRRTDNLD